LRRIGITTFWRLPKTCAICLKPGDETRRSIVVARPRDAEALEPALDLTAIFAEVLGGGAHAAAVRFVDCEQQLAGRRVLCLGGGGYGQLGDGQVYTGTRAGRLEPAVALEP